MSPLYKDNQQLRQRDKDIKQSSYDICSPFADENCAPAVSKL